MGESIEIEGEFFRLKTDSRSPCTVECPLETNVKAYVSLIAAGKFDEALEVVRLANPFPGICGRGCPHACEDKCIRGEIDEPISIAELKRFLTDYELRRGIIPRYNGPREKHGKIAVIGAGPAGLTCAADLTREGLGVTVFEALSEPGGMMAFGIPAYRLPRDILRVEIAAIEALGIEIRLNTPVGDSIKFNDIVRQFDAVFISAGAMRPRGLNIPGEEDVRHGLVNWVSFMREAAQGGGEKPGDSVVIVGGGNTAVDCARVSLRLGAKDVRIVYRRSREEMPAFKNEVSDAEEEGVEINFLAAPVRLFVEEGKLKGVECMRMKLGRKDKSGRRRPLPVPGSGFVISCDSVISAVGQELDTTFQGEEHGLRISDERLLVVDPDTMATTLKGVFAGGDAVTGASSVVEAIAAGHSAARSIIRYIRDFPLKYPEDEISYDLQELSLEYAIPPVTHRIEASQLTVKERKYSFDEIDPGFNESQAVAEASRCMRCGPCMECVECVGECEKKQIIMEPESLQPGQGLNGKIEMLIRVPLDIHQKVALAGGLPAQFGSGKYKLQAITAKIDEHLCRGCGMCEEVCGYRAVQVLYRGRGVFTARVDEDVCRGCGMCRAVCPTGAIDQNYFTSERRDRLVTEVLRGEGRGLPVVIFACRWSDLLKYPSDSLPQNIVRVVCMGSVTGGDVLKTFEKGAAGVLLAGCTADDCHYGSGRDRADENLRCVSSVLSLLGFGEKRLRFVQRTSGSVRDIAKDLASMERDFYKETEKLG